MQAGGSCWLLLLKQQQQQQLLLLSNRSNYCEGFVLTYMQMNTSTKQLGQSMTQGNTPMVDINVTVLLLVWLLPLGYGA